MGLPELLHSALHALPDVTLAVDPQSMRILDVNRAREALGHARADLGSMALGALIAMPAEDLVRFVQAADGRPVEVSVRRAGGAVVLASASAAPSAGAAASPCVIVVIRESPEYGRALEEVDRIRGVLSGALDALERVSEKRRPAVAPPPADDEGTTGAVVPRIPDLTLAQYVSLCVESELQPARVREINERYGLLHDQARGLLDRAFRDKLAADPALEAERAALHAKYLFWFTTQGRARQEGGAPPAPEPSKPVAPADQHAARTTAPSAGAPSANAALPFAPPPVPSLHRPAPQPAPLPPPAPPPHPPAGPAEARATIAARDVHTGAFALPFRPAAIPELSVDQYAALGVELEVYADRRAEVLARYGIHSESAWNACEEHWAARLVGDMSIRQRWMTVAGDIRKKLVRP